MGPGNKPLKFEEMTFSPISGYGWDQKDSHVKIYLTKDMDGIGKHDTE